MRTLLIILCISPLFLMAQQENLSSIQKYSKETSEGLLDGLPEGIYRNHQEIEKKAPSIQRKFFLKKTRKGIQHYFHYSENNREINKPFAIFHQGELYIRGEFMMSHRTKDSRNLSWEGGNYFLKIDIVGPFLFTEDFITPALAVFSAGVAGIIATRKSMPIIYVRHLRKFRYIRSYDHLKLFIETKYPQHSKLLPTKEDIKSQQGDFDLANTTRDILFKIKPN